MAKQKKNSNYVTEKNIAKKEAQEEQKRKEKQVQTVKIVAISVGAVLVVALAVLGILFALGAFEYYPEATEHVNITLADGTVFHVELYGNDAPTTVANFKKLYSSGYFNGKTAHTYKDGILYLGSETADGGSNGIKGEFKANGFDNKIDMEAGVLCMARGDNYDSAYGQFFILTKDSPKIQGDYAVFGKITDVTPLNKLVSGITTDADGKVQNPVKISSITNHSHDDHDH